MEYICSDCPLRFDKSADLLNHFMAAHMGLGRQRDSPPVQDLNEVLVVEEPKKDAENSGEEENCCKDCGKRFSTRGNLDRHSEMHRGVRYPCAVCGSVYSQKYAWGQHMKTLHPGWKDNRSEGRQRCVYCAEELPSKDLMDQHLKAMHCMSI